MTILHYPILTYETNYLGHKLFWRVLIQHTFTQIIYFHWKACFQDFRDGGGGDDGLRHLLHFLFAYDRIFSVDYGQVELAFYVNQTFGLQNYH